MENDDETVSLKVKNKIVNIDNSEFDLNMVKEENIEKGEK